MAGKAKKREDPDLVDRAAVAGELDLSVERIHQLVKLGMPQAARGRYSLSACSRWYRAYLQRLVTRRADIDEDGKPDDLEKERIRLTAAQADTAELELATARGEVISLVDHEAVVGDLIAQTRARVMAIPSRAAPRVIGLTDRHQIEKALSVEVREALIHLSRTVPRAPAPDDEAAEPAPAAKTTRKR